MAGISAGTVGDVGTFSFYPTKNLGALGDAGAVLCRDVTVAEKIRQLRQYGWDKKYHTVIAAAAIAEWILFRRSS